MFVCVCVYFMAHAWPPEDNFVALALSSQIYINLGNRTQVLPSPPIFLSNDVHRNPTEKKKRTVSNIISIGRTLVTAQAEASEAALSRSTWEC